MRTVHPGAFLVVEGVSDVRFWSTRRHPRCELVDGEGKLNVVGSVRRLDGEGLEGVLGVVDDDYDSLMGVDPGVTNIIRTDAHDLECILCRSSALEKVLAEFGDATKIRRFVDMEGVDVRTGLLNRALVFGRLRLAAMRHNLRIDRAAIRVQRFVDIDTWMVDREGLIRAVVMDGSPDDENVLIRCIAQLPSADPWFVVQGHDMVQVLRRGLMSALGDVQASVGPEQISQVLRSALFPNDLQATMLWADIRMWETANDAYPVLRV